MKNRRPPEKDDGETGKRLARNDQASPSTSLPYRSIRLP